MQQAADFLSECQGLHDLVSPMQSAELATITQFKNWTIEDVIGHLHMFNVAASLSIESDEKFFEFFAPIASDLNEGKSLLEAQGPWLGDLSGPALVDAWQEGFEHTANTYSNVDPKHRIKWAGPDMSARSSITARQMETWAHGQAIFDVLGVARIDTDGIKNIAHLGINTFGWTFVNRQWEVPNLAPHVSLLAPSGERWEWNEPQTDNCLTGSATEFCQVVTQTRHVGDTKLVCTGEAATKWMQNAQCFAGPPHAPPPPGSRFLVK